ncbi:uncharacterized protein [Nicotiana sylvestris]|uniref:uncharacterized protein n=1 Tax=Nicotiana sylvestris TaxID=4096 RepID=UPI00388C6035
MANTPENLSSPPQEATSTPSTTPSTAPLSKKIRVKMMARKIFDVGEQIKKSRFVLVGSIECDESIEPGKVGGKNKKGKEKESEGARSTVRGKGKRVVDSLRTPMSLTKDTGAMVVWGEKSGGIEESETLVDLLKKVTESYNPNKKRNSKSKTLGTARANKKREVAPSVTVEIPPTRGRSTRRQKKQIEAELEKALEESRRKAVAKGKKNMSEPVEAVDLDEMDLVLRDEDDTEKVKILTPKPKKAKTSTKKSVSESNSAEPSTLAKKTRSVVKSKQVKMVEEKEWSGEEEDGSNAEKDKMAKFGKRTILKGILI